MSSSSSSFRGRRFHVGRQPVVVDIGCSCRKPKLFSLLSLSRLNNHVSSKSSRNSSESTCSLTTTITNSTFSPCNDTTSSSSSSYASPNKKKKKKAAAAAVVRKQQQEKKKKAGLMAEESVAVEKESSDPYLDFKDSMLQMIVEKEIYEWDELRELLDLFLSLNSPYHHHLILRAFAEIWQGVFSPPPPRSYSPATTRH